MPILAGSVPFPPWQWGNHQSLFVLDSIGLSGIRSHQAFQNLLIVAHMGLENAVEGDLNVSLEEDRCNLNLLSIFLTILWSHGRLFEICRGLLF